MRASTSTVFIEDSRREEVSDWDPSLQQGMVRAARPTVFIADSRYEGINTVPGTRRDGGNPSSQSNSEQFGHTSAPSAHLSIPKMVLKWLLNGFHWLSVVFAC